jgi:hypothetical protein
MLTREQALTASEFHADGCYRTVGPRGGVTEHVVRYRRNGATKTWKTRPLAYRVPVKYGYRGYGAITEHDAPHMHVASDCPLRATS